MDIDQLKAAKLKLRSEMRRKRDSLPETYRENASLEVAEHIINWLRQRNKSSNSLTVMAYLATRSELDISRVMEWCWNNDINVTVPLTNPKEKTMKLYELDSWEQLRPGAYQILEPDPLLAKPFQFSPHIIFVPGISFDLQGGRMGYGGGYYDRFAEELDRLNQATSRSSDYSRADLASDWLGICYEQQLVKNLPIEQHDITMNAIVTERGIYNIS